MKVKFLFLIVFFVSVFSAYCADPISVTMRIIREGNATSAWGMDDFNGYEISLKKEYGRVVFNDNNLPYYRFIIGRLGDKNIGARIDIPCFYNRSLQEVHLSDFPERLFRFTIFSNGLCILRPVSR